MGRQHSFSESRAHRRVHDIIGVGEGEISGAKLIDVLAGKTIKGRTPRCFNWRDKVVVYVPRLSRS